MMKFVRVIALGTLAGQLMLASVGLEAQTLGQPAEFPPDSYGNRQYVDSKGCVFIRAGVNGAVTWVPRVTRDRRQICGQRPTFAGAQTPVTEDKRGQRGVVEITNDAAPAARVAAAPVAPAEPVATAVAPAPAAKPAPTPQVRKVAVAPAPQPARQTRRVVRRAPVAAVAAAPAAPARVRRVAPVAPVAAAPKRPERIVKRAVRRVEPVATARARGRLASSPCAGLTGNSARYYGTSGLPVRCGTQFEAQGYVQVDETRVPGKTRIVPRHVYEARRAAGALPKTPRGYRRVWEDDRLNPKRAVGTVEGYRAMDLVWTRDVPRRLVDRTSGKDVTAQYRTLLYPFTDPAMQARWQANRDRYAVQMSQRTGAVRLVDGDSGRVVAASPATPAPAPVIASKSAPKRPAAKGVAAPVAKARAAAPKGVRVGKGHRYVQIGVFGDADKASDAVRRLHGLGLPVSRKVAGGRTTIVAGPFRSPGALATGLLRVRGAGYGNAYTR